MAIQEEAAHVDSDHRFFNTNLHALRSMKICLFLGMIDGVRRIESGVRSQEVGSRGACEFSYRRHSSCSLLHSVGFKF